MSTELVHILHLASANGLGASRLMDDMLYLNGVNLHHGAVAGEREMDRAVSFHVRSRLSAVYLRHNRHSQASPCYNEDTTNVLLISHSI